MTAVLETQASSNQEVSSSSKRLKRRMTFIGTSCYAFGEENAAHESIITSLMFFKRPLDRAKVLDVIKEKLLIYERFYSFPCVENGEYLWQEAESLDFDYHLREVDIGGEQSQEDLENYIQSLFAESLDKDRPLWRCTLVKLGDGRGVSILQVHHAIGDGTTLVQVLFSMLQEKPVDSSNKEEMEAKQKDFVVLKKSNPSWLETAANPFEFSRRFCLFLKGAIQAIHILTFKSRDTKSAIKIDSAHKLTTKKLIGIGNHVDLDVIKEIKSVVGGTVNDVLVAILAGTIQRYLEKKKDPSIHKADFQLTGVFPYNLRMGAVDIKAPGQFGNNFTFVPMAFPTVYRNRVSLLADCKRRCDEMKFSPMPLLLVKSNEFLGKLFPAKIRNLITINLFDKFSFLFSNVPGPRKPVFLCGEECEDMMFFAPSLFGCLFNIFSYNNRVSLGVMSDPECVSDPKEMTKCFAEEAHALYDEVKALHSTENKSLREEKGVVSRQAINYFSVFTVLLTATGLWRVYLLLFSLVWTLKYFTIFL